MKVFPEPWVTPSIGGVVSVVPITACMASLLVAYLNGTPVAVEVVSRYVLQVVDVAGHILAVMTIPAVDHRLASWSPLRQKQTDTRLAW